MKNKSGFTIIEVVMVLAIAGLIFAVVFGALPLARRASRDGQRKTALATIGSELENYANNNRGSYPNSWPEIRDLVQDIEAKDSNFKDPQLRKEYSLLLHHKVPASKQLPNEVGSILYGTGFKCSDDNTSLEANNFSRTYGMLIRLEAGISCQDSN